MKRLLGVLSVVLFANQASAEYLSLFPGTITCAEYLNEENSRTEDNTRTWKHVSHLAWVLGFVSGINAAMNNDLGKDTQAAFEYIVKQYCQDNPLDSLSQSADNLVLKLLKDTN
mgnify:CR=1 FL=1